MQLAVREMQPTDADVRINYFHDSSDDHLHMLGVDRALLPTRAAWRESYEADFALPPEQRASYALIWEVDGKPVGFSTTDRIVVGEEAFMHLHILNPHQRRSGLGAQFVKESAAAYFRVLDLQRLFCEPNAFNVAPNRAVQSAGFRYLFTHRTSPGPINFPQATTRWVLDRSGVSATQSP
jgi:RimJ/RimL family protein N-acetyltransferase